MLNKKIIALAFGGFSIGMTEFVMMGILPDIASDLGVSIPEAGHLIAIYAIGVVIGAPLLVLLASKSAPKKVLMLMMVLFGVFHLLFTFSPNYTLLLVSRFLSGLPHGAFFGVGSIVAARIAPKGKEAQAISLMFAGLSAANLIGVPLGTYIGHHFDWRISYFVIAALGFLTFLALRAWLPNLDSNDEPSPVSVQLGFFKRWQGLLLTAMISIGTGGLFAWLSYIAPMMTEIAGISADNVSWVMILVGLGMFIGNLIGGKIADTVTPNKAAITSFVSMAIILTFVYLFSHITTVALILTFLTGLITFTVGPSLQLMLIKAAKGPEKMLASASGQASFNIGNALGAFLGGIPISYGMAYNSPILVGIVMASMGAILGGIYLVKSKNNSTSNSNEPAKEEEEEILMMH